jgi:hypothetical protein
MALELFISHFASNASLQTVPNRPQLAQLKAAPAEVAPTEEAPTDIAPTKEVPTEVEAVAVAPWC